MTAPAVARDAARDPETGRLRVAIFGHFGVDNFGNESTLQAVLHHVRRLRPDADLTCICSNPEATTEAHGVRALPITHIFLRWWRPRNPLVAHIRRSLVGVPGEPLRWLKCYRVLRETDVLIVPGTGLLTDVAGLRGFGPYSLLKWSWIAKRCRCKLLFVSVGAGPLSSSLGRRFARTALSLADFRSYRDTSTREYLREIGFRADEDPVYPDLVFSLPEQALPSDPREQDHRRVVGIGVMADPDKLRPGGSAAGVYEAYIESLVSASDWLLANGYDIRLLVGDVADERAKRDFMALAAERIAPEARERIADEPVASVDDLVAQIAETDLVIATRFHNVILSLLSRKPVLAISFHHKCESLMNALDLSDYCLDIERDVSAEELIAKVSQLEANTETLQPQVRARTEEFRRALESQYLELAALELGATASQAASVHA